MSQGRFRSFLTGALVGAGLGILLAPKEGSETRSDLKKSFSLLIDTIKNIDVEETKAAFLDKVSEIKKELSEIDETTAKKVAKEKVEIIEEKCNELITSAKEEGAIVVEKAAKEVKDSAIYMLHEFLDELEAKEKEVETKPTKKKGARSKSSKNNTTKKTTKTKRTKKEN